MVQLLEEIKHLPVSKRFALVDQILQTIGDQEISPRFKSELLKRGNEMKSNMRLGRKWSQVKAGPIKK